MFLFAFGFVAISMDANQSEPASSNVQKVYSILSTCPSWQLVNPTDRNNTQELQVIQGSLEKIAGFDTATIADGAQKYMDAVWIEHKQIDQWDPYLIRILTRLIFDVPVQLSMSEWHSMAGYIRPLQLDGDRVCVLWPFRRDSNGKLKLIGYYRGVMYNGPMVDPVFELRAFAKQYQRRSFSIEPTGQPKHSEDQRAN